MTDKTGRKHYIDTLATLLIFAVFAICIISAILLGAKSYKAVSSRDAAAYDMRTCTQFIANKVRYASTPQSVSVVDIDGVSALKIDQMEDGVMYCTYIYSYDGWLREYFAASDKQVKLSAGEKLLEMQNIEFSMDNALISCRIVSNNGSESSLFLNLRGAEVAA